MDRWTDGFGLIQIPLLYIINIDFFHLWHLLYNHRIISFCTPLDTDPSNRN